MVQIPKFEALEDRIVLDASPDVTIDAPADIEIGAQDVPITLTFDNGGTNDSGFAPYVDLVIPSTGSDGDDGVTFDSASFLGQPIVTNEIVFDVNGEAVHPYATDTNGDPLVITAGSFGAQPGDTLIVFQLPYGSFSPGNPPVDIDVVLDFSENADIADDFTLSAVGGFSLGEDALDNPGADAPLRGATDTATVSQTLFEVTKNSNVPEEEAATGPSFPYQYTLLVDVADGQTLDNFSLTDNLPPSIVYLGGLTINGGTGGTVVAEPPVGAQVTPTTNLVQIDFTEVSGQVAVTFDYYIAETDGTADVLDPNTGLGTVVNQVTGTGDWTPLDPRDATQTGLTDTGRNELTASALNIQKGVSLPVDTGEPGATPGDEYVFTLNIQVADYSVLSDLEIEDVLGNGWDYVEGSASFVVTEQGQNIASTGFDEAATGDLDVDLSDFNTTGDTTLTFDLSQAMITAGQDGLLSGDIALDGVSDGISTVVTITYRAEVRDAFSDPGGTLGLPQIGQGDVLTNDVAVTANLRDPANPTGPALGAITNDSEAAIAIDVGGIREKTIAAINGVAPGPNPIIAAGDTVTFSIIYDSPLGSFDDLRITDNLPQLVFDATEAGTFYDPTTGPAIPPAGQATYGPNDTFFAAFQASGLAGSGLPTVATNGPDNQIDYNFGGLSISPREPVVVEILFTVTVQDAIFAPDLFLTNQSTAFEGNVAVGETDTTAIVQFNYAEPELNITKGVVAFDPDPNSDVVLGDTGPVTFNAPGTTGPRFAGTITSDALETDPIDANIEGIDAGDTLTFAIVVENTGRAPNGAFDVNIQDTLPPGLSLVPGSVFVTDGTGAAISFTGDLFAGGITLTDPPPVGGLLEGAIAGFDPTAGDNIAIVTYDVTVDAGAVPAETFTNTSSVGNFAATEGGVDRVPTGGLSDDATARIDSPEITKELSFRQFTDSGDIANGGAAGRGGNEVVVGENVEFTIRIDIPEADFFDVVITDRVTIGGLVIDSAVISNSPVAGQTGTSGVVSGNEVTFSLGDFVNAADNDLTNDFIEITVSARVDDAAGFDAGDLTRNVASFEYATTDGGPTTTIRDGANLRLTEPNLTLDKESTDADDIVAVGDTVTYEIDIANLRGSRDAPAFDLTLTDQLPAAFMTLDPASIVLEIDGVAVAFNGTDFALTPNAPANGFTIFIDRLDPDQTATIRYEAEVAQTVPVGTNINNTADLTFDSTPEDDSGGPDGDDREYSLSDTETVRTAGPEIDKIILAGSSSYGETDDPELGIGETVTYELTVTIPEGSVDGVILTDTLPAGMEFVSATLVRFGNGGGLLIDEVGPLPTGTHAAGVTTFDFGDLTNTFDGIQNAEDEIVVQITARLTATGTDTSQTLTNTGALEFVDGQGATQTVTDTADIDVVEPDMSIAKAVTPATADAGDIVSYVVTAQNDGDGPAYDMVINDDVVGALVALDPTTVSLTIRDENGAVVSTVAAGTAPLGAAVEDTLGFRATGGMLEIVVPVLQAGHSVEIGYDAEVQDGALFSTAYVNTAEVTRYDSNPDGTEVTDPAAPAQERVYDATLAGYTVPDATATFSTPDASLTKTYLGSSDTNTADATGTANAQLNVGETVTYELVIDIPEGTANLVLTDALPIGLTPVSAEVIAMNGAVSANGLVDGTTDASGNITITPIGTGGTVAFDFGSVTLSGGTTTDPANSQIVVQVTALVADVLPQVADGETLTNSATLEVTNPAGGADLQPDVLASEAVDIVEPDVTIDKTGPIAGDPGDTVQYTITLENTGTGPAYDGVLTDPLADGFLTFAGNITGTYSTGATVPAGDITGTPFTPGSDGFVVSGITLLPGESLTVTFDVFIELNAPEANSFNNTATFVFDTVEDGDPTTGGRSDTVTDDHRIATIPFIFKEPFDSSNPDTNSDDPTDTPFDLAVGEEVTYRYLITLPELPGQTVSITDDLPDGFRFVEAEVDLTGSLLTGANLSSATGLTVGANAGGPTISLVGNDVTFDFGAIGNPVDGIINAGDSFYLLVTAVVEDDPANVAGADRTNTVTLDVDPDGPGGLGLFNQQDSSADVRIVEPLLEIDKTGPLALSNGQSGVFTITATNTGPSVTPSATGPAYDIDITDVLPAGMTLDATPFTVQIDGVATAFTETRSATGFTIEVPTLLPDQVLTISYGATLDAAALPLQTFTNTATANYDSAPGDPVDSQGNPIIDRDATPVDDTHTVASGPTLDKAVTGTSNPLTGDALFDAFDDLAIGEEATYQLVITLPDIPMDTVQLVDALPPGMDFVSAQVLSTDADITINGATSITDAGQNVTFLFNDVDNAIGGTNQITVEVVARVNALASNVDDADLTNTGTLTITPQGEGPLTPVTDTATVEVVEPELTLDKVGNIAVNPGDTIDYTITIENTGNAPAYDLIIADPMNDPFLSLVSGTVVVTLDSTNITADLNIIETAAGFTVELDDINTGEPFPVPVGAIVTVTYQALLDANAPDAESFPNTASVDYDTLPGDPVDANGDPIPDRDYSADDTHLVATVPFLTKAPTASSFAETTANDTELNVGEEVTFTYELFLPEVGLEQVYFFDDLPDGLDYVSFNVVSTGDITALGGGAIPAPVVTVSGNDVELVWTNLDNPLDPLPLGSIGPDDIITIEVTARVNDQFTAGTDLVNNALIEVDPVGAPPLNQATATSTVTVVEPELTVAKTGPQGANPGDTIPYQIVVENSHPSGATGPAYDVSIVDTLPTGITLDTATLVFTSDQRGVLTPTSLTATTGGFDAGFAFLQADEILTITYTATLDPLGATVSNAQTFRNEVDVNYDSAPGNDPNQKVYAEVSDDHRVGTIPALEKAILSTDITQTGSGAHDPLIDDVNVGELITYQLTLTIPELDDQLVVLSDTLPAGLEFVSSRVSAVGAEITAGATLGATNVASVAGQVVTFTFTNVDNTYAVGTPQEGVIDADDQIVIDVVVRVADVAAATDGAQLTNDARLNVQTSDGFNFTEQQDQATVEVVEPQIDIVKSVSDAEPMVGDTITYTVVLSNDPAATGPAFNLVITDALPTDLSLVGAPRLSDPSLGSVLSGSGSTLVVSAPLLLPGQSLTVEYDVFVGFLTPVLQGVENTASVVGSTTPFGPGRALDDLDKAVITADPVPTSVDDDVRRFAGGGIDDAQFLPILLIDPIFSGTAEPGANVTVSLYRQDGSMSYVRNIVADAGGHWIALFPRVELEQVEDDFWSFYDRSALFDAPNDPLDNMQRSSFGTPIAERTVTIGTLLDDEGYTVSLQQDRPSTLPQDNGMHNARTYFNPATVGEGYGVGVVLKVDEVFDDIAGLTVERLYQSSVDPLGTSLNRFNYEFLSDATALPGSAR